MYRLKVNNIIKHTSNDINYIISKYIDYKIINNYKYVIIEIKKGDKYIHYNITNYTNCTK